MSFNVGFGGSWHYGAIGYGGESGVAIDTAGSICFYTQTCWTLGLGVAGGVGVSVGGQTGGISSGDQESEGIFMSGGAGVFGGGQGTQGADGSMGLSKGFGGVGSGAAGGRIYCTTRYYCPWKPKGLCPA